MPTKTAGPLFHIYGAPWTAAPTKRGFKYIPCTPPKNLKTYVDLELKHSVLELY